MTQQELNRSYVGASGQQVGCKAVSQTMQARVLVNLRSMDGLFEGALHR